MLPLPLMFTCDQCLCAVFLMLSLKCRMTPLLFFTMAVWCPFCQFTLVSLAFEHLTCLQFLATVMNILFQLFFPRSLFSQGVFPRVGLQGQRLVTVSCLVLYFQICP